MSNVHSHAYLCGKGGSLDNVTPDWFPDKDAEIWCLNQSATVIRRLLPDREVHCVVNDDWINYTPPDDVIWHCHLRVPTDNHPHVVRYNPENLVSWSAPSCMCALQLMFREGYDTITMIGFDSHFDNSRTYAESIGVKSDEIAPFHIYDTMMRRFADANKITLNWVDGNGICHPDTHRYSCCILGVAKGEKYEKQTDRMIESFLKHNPDWTAERYYGDRLEKALPKDCRAWTDFNKCEIGRWVAMRDLLDKYDTVLYADGDIRWYKAYDYHLNNHLCDLVLTPHTVTGRASASMRHQIMKDGRANIGIVEANRWCNRDMLYDFIIGEVLHEPVRFKHGTTLWLQPLVSSCSDTGFDVQWSDDFSTNVATWNIRKGDRELVKKDGQYFVVCDGHAWQLRSFHFSSKSLDLLRFLGDATTAILEEYRNE